MKKLIVVALNQDAIGRPDGAGCFPAVAQMAAMFIDKVLA